MRSDQALAMIENVEKICKELRHQVDIAGEERPRIVHAFRRLKLNKQSGYPRGGNGGRGTGISDPTAVAVEDVADRSFAALQAIVEAELANAVNALDDAAHDVKRIVDVNVQTSWPQAKNDPGCVLCDTAKLANGKPHPRSWQKAAARKAPAARADEMEDMPRCSFHYEWAERYGIDTGPVITVWHLDNPGRQVPYSMVKDQHPDAYERYHSRRWVTDGTGGVNSFRETH